MSDFRILFLLLSLGYSMVWAQEKSTVLMAFYNVENLFDTQRHNASGEPIPDYDKPGWDKERYQVKIDNLSRVIRQLGSQYDKEGPDLLGLAEVENAGVIRDLIQNDRLRAAGYEFIHRDSPDRRGIDVALLYRTSAFIPHNVKTHRLLIYTPEGYRLETRDLLVVSGYLEEELIHILVNHWPSRRGGKSESSAHRISAARLNRKVMDSLIRVYSDPFIITMGDLNDDPTDTSVYNVMRGREQADDSLGHTLYNPMLGLYRKGYGSLAYRDRWHLFDQILMSGKTIYNEGKPFKFRQAGIFMPKWVRTQRGAYRGYPLRTYTGDRYTGGYSDHFPVYVVFTRKTSESGKRLIEPGVVRDPGKNKD